MKKANASLYGGTKFLGTPVSTSGELVLEGNTLTFVPSRLHTNAEVVELSLQRIEAIGTERIKLGFGLGMDGLKLVCAGESYLFGVRRAGEWVETIREATVAEEVSPIGTEAQVMAEIPAATVSTGSSTEEGAEHLQAAVPPSARRDEAERRRDAWGSSTVALVCAGLGLLGALTGFVGFWVIGSLVSAGTFSFSPVLQVGLYDVFVLRSDYLTAASALAGVLTGGLFYVYFASQR